MVDKSVSQALADRSRQVMPWGSSTCSKAPEMFPEEPGVIVKGAGCRVWDADGREFIDFRNGLGPVTLGYQFPAVDEAIRKQLESGIVFGHPHPLECEVAEMVCDLVPCAEQARFLKTGGEAIAAAIRIARHYTGRDHIIQIGYNGWLNSLAAGAAMLPGQQATSIPGVPQSVSALHHTAAWNDLSGLERLFDEYDGQIAALSVAADYAGMEEGRTFYPAIRALTRKHGCVLIFDEIVTGFRIAVGGVQEYFGVVPDIAVFSKGIANGMPLSVYAGSKEIMKACDVGGAIITSTFGGEALSLAAAKASIATYRHHGVIGHLWKQGERMWPVLNRLFAVYSIPLEVRGFWPCPIFVQSPGTDGGWKDRFFRLAYRYGVSLYNVSYVNFSHSENDIDEALSRLEFACEQLGREMHSG